MLLLRTLFDYPIYILLNRILNLIPDSTQRSGSIRQEADQEIRIKTGHNRKPVKIAQRHKRTDLYVPRTGRLTEPSIKGVLNFDLRMLLLAVPPDDSLMCPPSFTTKLQDRTVNDGEPLVINCAIKGDPDPQVSWLKNGQVRASLARGGGCRFRCSCRLAANLISLILSLQVLSSSDVLDLKYKGGIATLSINEVFPEDEGSYTCKATNTMGTAETTCKLSVKRE